MHKDVIYNFPSQLDYQPVIENADKFHVKDKFIVCGIGGSNLAAGIIESWRPKLDIVIHRDYGLPEIEDRRLKKYLVIASSYSGNTEETISALKEAQARGLSTIVIATGGTLLELAKKDELPYIQMPRINGNPRFAVGLNITATLKAMGQEGILSDLQGLSKVLDVSLYEKTGKEFAKKLEDRMPIIYSSGQNAGLARHWKISFNETSKVPAFYNFLPEANHNEMIGFDSKIFDSKLNHKFAFIFLNDPDDGPHIQRRILITKKIFESRGYTILDINLSGPSLWHKSFVSILSAMWTSYYLAEYYSVDPEDISVIEDFKKSLS